MTQNYPTTSAKTIGLFDYARCGIFDQTVSQLKIMAMTEEWEYKNTPSRRSNPILVNYLFHTFNRVKEENKILESGKYSCFNTGLVTNNQQEIFMLFKQSDDGLRRFFVQFCKESDNNLTRFSALPDRASYFENVTELMYDPHLQLRLNIDHIIDDQENFNRFPPSIKTLPKQQIINTFHGAIEHAKKRVKRNYLTAIPQFYNGKLQLLLPLCLIETTKADLALAIYKEQQGFYNGRTCLTLDMAINNARLITKPDDEWLKP